MSEQKEPMTVKEAGRRGGSKVRDKYGSDFFKSIGQKGGKQTAASHGHEFYQTIGKKGGAKGGARVRELIERARREEALEQEGTSR
ncbi:MAG TPA: hypothetical protein VGN26_00130 [Armatimonadota bacterium]|jgi:hypothetical protein